MQCLPKLDALRAREELTQTLIISFTGLDFIQKNLCRLLLSLITTCNIV